MSNSSTMRLSSHGRGGIGNIGEDPFLYAGSKIVRQRVSGDHGDGGSDGTFSTGRGGVANVASSKIKAAAGSNDERVIPQTALRPSLEDENFHIGRGGIGNVHLSEPPAIKKSQGLVDKLNNLLFRKITPKAGAQGYKKGGS